MSSHRPSKSRAFSRSSTASPIYSPPVATRPKSHGPPRVLPLPDLPLRGSRDNSRSASPSASPRLSSPRGSGDGPLLNVTAIEMVTGRSSDGFPFSERTGIQSGSPPTFASNVITAAMLNVPSSSRPRASTSPFHAHPRTTGFVPHSSADASTATHVSAEEPERRSGEVARPTSPGVPLISNLTSAISETRKAPLDKPPPFTALTEHLYASFLNGTCADVRLWVRKWNVSWMLHKMVLVQASFFQSLFMGGFSEMSGARRSRKGKERASDFVDDDWAGDDIELQFDDPNITRAAFEICLSRLYSTHPTLHIPASHLPYAFQPLTRSFPAGLQTPLAEMAETLRLDSQLATPRLLLSLLATTIYLGHTPLLKEVLGMILRTISPLTVCRYLDFAIDGSIGEEEWEGQDGESARHLSGVGKEFPLRPHRSISPIGEETPRGADTPYDTDDLRTNDEGEAKVGGSSTSLDNSPQKKAGWLPDIDESTSSRRPSDARQPHFYGVASNKIGEAVVCWLARWAVDIMNVESHLEAGQEPGWSVWGHRGIPARFVRACLCSDQLFVRDELERYMLARRILDLRRKGWAVESDSTDGDISLQRGRLPSFSSRTDLDEQEAMEPWEEDELELGKVFAEGIYYSHMSFDDLATISWDIDPYNEMPFVPMDVLHSAHWASTNLRSRIQANVSASPERGDGELGFSRSFSDIVTSASRRVSGTRSRTATSSSLTSDLKRGFDPYETIRSSTRSPVSHGSQHVYHPIVPDESLRLGHNGLVVPPTLIDTSSPHADLALGGMLDDGLAALRLGEESTSEARPSRRIEPPQGESTAFGLDSGKLALSDFSDPGLSERAKQVQSWATAEPFRFSVEFWGVNQLADKDRLYSPVHFYAGSWWLVYLQLMRRTDKNGEPQLGIYLQRWDMAQPPPKPSGPPHGAIRGGALVPDSLAKGVAVTHADAGSSTGQMPTRSRTTRIESFDSANRTSSALASRGGEDSSADNWRRRSDGMVTFGSSSLSPASPAPPPSTAISADMSRDDGSRSRSGVTEYTDERKVVKAYFSVICSSAIGTSLVRFNSSPDVFAQSQSWGWKSSALRSDEYLGYPLDAQGGIVIDGGTQFEMAEGETLGWMGPKAKSGQGRGNLRASVVLGVI